MTEYSWAATYEKANELFHDTPNAEQEQVALDAFKEFPRHVTEQIDQIGAGVTSGNVRSGWAVLRQRLATGPADVTVTDTSDRQKRIKAARAWISNAGLHHDRESELLDDLFGYTGLLRAWPDDERLRTEMATFWEKVRTEPQRLDDGIRPSGEELERLDWEYFQRLNDSRAEVQAAVLKARGGSNRAVGLKDTIEGDCDDCRKPGPRFHYGKFLVCSNCAGTRQKVARRLQREHLPGDLEVDLPLKEALT